MAPTAQSQPYTITYQPGRLITADEYARMPEEPGWRTELTDGRVVRIPTVKDPRHDWVLDNLTRRLSPYVFERRLGRLTFEQVGYNIPPPYRQGDYGWAPDLAFVRAEQLPSMQAAIASKQYVPFAPDLVVGIISPSQSRKEATEKAQTWLASGARLVWNIWIDEQRVEVWQVDEPMDTLSVQDRLDGLEVVPGFSMPVADLFEF